MLGAGVRVVSLDPVRRVAVAELPLRRRNRNAGGTHFGGAIATLCDPFFAYLVAQLVGDEYDVWDRSSQIEFRRRSTRALRATFQIDDAAVAQLREDITKRGSALIPCRTEVRDTAGALVAVVAKEVYVRRRTLALTLADQATAQPIMAIASLASNTVMQRKGAGRRNRSLSAFTSSPVAVITLVRMLCARSLKPSGERRVAWAVTTDRGLVRCYAEPDGEGWRVVAGPCTKRHLEVSLTFPDLIRLSSGELTMVRGALDRKLQIAGWLPWLPWAFLAGYREQRSAQRLRREPTR